MRKSIAAMLAAGLIVTLSACGSYNTPKNPNAVPAPAVSFHAPSTPTPSPSIEYVNSNDHGDLEWAYEVCRFGAQQFYLARNIPIPETESLAIRDCDKNLEFHGIDNFIIFYSPIPH